MTPYSPPDMILASDIFGAKCGHGALAAAIGVPVMDVMQHFERGGWVNVPMMKTAILSAGRKFVKYHGIPFGGEGVALIQFLGKWMEPQVPKTARCAHRHWIGLKGGMVWDANIMHWTTPVLWEAWVPALYSDKTTGHQIESEWLIL